VTATATTAVPARPGAGAAISPLWVTVEGINGVGKTTAIKAATPLLGSGCLRLGELTDQNPDTLPGRLISALSAADDVYLRTGHPIAETLALLALKTREYERYAPQRAPGLDLILEDRGIDTVAAYQAAIIEQADPGADALALAEQILRQAVLFRPPPDYTVLLLDEREACLGRFEQRLNIELTQRDRQLVGRIEQLYRALADAEPDRYIPLTVIGMTANQSAHRLAALCRSLIDADAGADCGT
jgi:dTMP kinase